MATRQRIDRLLVERGLFESRAKAQAAIAAGRVTADDATVARPSDEVPPMRPCAPSLPIHGCRAAASSLRPRSIISASIRPAASASMSAPRPAASPRCCSHAVRARVYAVDVGRGQLHPSLRARPEIVSLEETDVRELDPARLPERPGFVTVDVSFISLKLVLPAALQLVQAPGYVLALIKPQFEAGRRAIRKGIVRDPLVQAAVCDDLAAFVASLGWTVAGIAPSPITGGDGNHEFFIAAHRA